MSGKLTNKQKQFCLEYLIDLNATQAAIRAGYSEKTANRIGHENLTKLDIQEEIKKLMDERVARTQNKADSAIESIIRTRNICEKFLVLEGENGEYLNSVALNGLNKNNEMLGRHEGAFVDKVEHSGEIKMPIIKISK